VLDADDAPRASRCTGRLGCGRGVVNWAGHERERIVLSIALPISTVDG
jgi:hypothetical protein